jgi:hypothetical protein
LLRAAAAGDREGAEDAAIAACEEQRPAAVCGREAWELLEAPRVRAYVDDLRALLSRGFLRSFIKRIEFTCPTLRSTPPSLSNEKR